MVTPIRPHLRFWDMRTDTVIAASDVVLEAQIERELDVPNKLSFAVPLADADASPALQNAVGGTDGVTYIPTFVEFSFGGADGAVDIRHQLGHVTSQPHDADPRISAQGDDLAVLLGDVVLMYQNYVDCGFADVMDAAVDTIVPLDPGHYGISSTNTLPGVAGILQVQPGRPAWGGAARLVFTAYVDSLLQGLPTNLEVWGDTTLRTVDNARQVLGGVIVPGDSLDQGRRGHVVYDTADGFDRDGSPFNLAAQLGYLTSPSGPPFPPPQQANAAVIGNAGGGPSPLFAFADAASGSGPLILDESIEARVITDELELDTDLSEVFSAVSFLGGDSNAGFPEGYRISALAMLNGAPPLQSATRDQFQDNLLLVGIDQNDGHGGGLFWWFGDGLLRPWPNSPTWPVLAITQDGANGLVLVGTPIGVFSHPADVTDQSGWTAVGNLGARVVGLQVVPDGAGHSVYFARVDGTPDKRLDGIYRFVTPSGDAGSHYGGWDSCLQAEALGGLVATDAWTYWTIVKGEVYRYTVAGAGGGTGTITRTAMPLPSGVQATRLARVITTTQDSVWAMTAGNGQPAYFWVNVAGSWGTALPANADASLVAADGTPLTANGAGGLGLTLNGQLTSVFLFTNGGVWWSATLDGTGWKTLNGTNGLDGISIRGIAAGQQQVMIGHALNVFYAFNDTQLFCSRTAGRLWTDLTQSKLEAGIYLTELVLAATSAYPANVVRTIGPQAASPLTGSPVSSGALSDDGTHVKVTGTAPQPTRLTRERLPATWYWERRLDGRNGWWYWLVRQDSPVARQKTDQLTDLGTTAALSPLEASRSVAIVMRSFLGSHATPITTLTVGSAFATAEAGLRRLKPSMRVPVTVNRSVPSINRAGAMVDVPWIALNAVPMFVVKHVLQLAEGCRYVKTTTTLSTQLGTRPTPQDFAAALVSNTKALKLFGSR